MFICKLVSKYVHIEGSCLWPSLTSAVLYNSKIDIFTGKFEHFKGRPYSTKSSDPPWRILFFGTDDFALKSVQPLCAKLHTKTLMSDLAVVCGQGSVRAFAEAEKLHIIEWPLKEEEIRNKFDLGVVVSFGHLIPEDIIKAFPLGILNVHGSLLPRWRGAAPIVYAIMNGDPETGVTIMKINPHKFDTGDVVRQYRCSVSPHDTTPKVTYRLAEQGAGLLMECVRDLPRCVEMAAPQQSEGVTYAPRVNLELSKVNWTKMSAKQVYNLHRALSHLHLLTTDWHGRKTRLLDITIDLEEPAGGYKVSQESSSKSAISFLNNPTEIISAAKQFMDSTNIKPGTIFYNKQNKTIKVQCADGMFILCRGFRMGGKNLISPHEFYNGYLSKKSESEWYFS